MSFAVASSTSYAEPRWLGRACCAERRRIALGDRAHRGALEDAGRGPDACAGVGEEHVQVDAECDGQGVGRSGARLRAAVQDVPKALRREAEIARQILLAHVVQSQKMAQIAPESTVFHVLVLSTTGAAAAPGVRLAGWCLTLHRRDRTLFSS